MRWAISLVQRNPTECGESECDRVNSTMRRPYELLRHGGKEW